MPQTEGAASSGAEERRSERILSHFAGFRLRDHYWSAPAEERARLWPALAGALAAAAPRAELYQLFPARADADLLVWTAAPAGREEAPAELFAALGRAFGAARPFLTPTHALWGFTRPSPYLRTAAARGIDAVGGERLPYLVVYPFAKTADWYLTGAEERQAMMNEHIRVGHSFAGVEQLLLYSFGLQDHEFVVVYETRDLALFSELVRELRATEGRRYTALDSPVLTAVRRTAEELAGLW